MYWAASTLLRQMPQCLQPKKDRQLWWTGAEPQNVELNQQPPEADQALFRLVIVSSQKGIEPAAEHPDAAPLEKLGSITGHELVTTATPLAHNRAATNDYFNSRLVTDYWNN